MSTPSSTSSEPTLDPSASLFKQFAFLLKYRRLYRWVILSQAISFLGSWLTYITVSMYTLTQDQGGGLALALVFLGHSLPNALVAPLAGPLADRMNRKTIMLISNLVAAMLTFGLCVCVAYESLWTLQVVLFLRTAVSGFGMNARQAALPQLVKKEEIYPANALNSVMWSSLFTFGVALGGVLYGWLGAQWTLVLDAFTFLIALGFLLNLVPLYPDQASVIGEEQEKVPSSDSSCIQKGESTQSHQTHQTHSDQCTEHKPESLIQVWKKSGSTPLLRLALLGKVPDSAVAAIGWMALNLLVAVRYGVESAGILGTLHALRGLGTGLGPVLLKKIFPHQIYTPSWFTVLGVVGLIWIDSFEVSLACVLLWGMGGGANWVQSTTLIQAQADSRYLGRFTALDFLFFTCVQSSLVLLIGAVIDLFEMSIETLSSALLVPIICGLIYQSVKEYRLRTHDVHIH